MELCPTLSQAVLSINPLWFIGLTHGIILLLFFNATRGGHMANLIVSQAMEGWGILEFMTIFLVPILLIIWQLR